MFRFATRFGWGPRCHTTPASPRGNRIFYDRSYAFRNNCSGVFPSISTTAAVTDSEQYLFHHFFKQIR
ncbi:hypothetical protein D3OALGA1CA_2804 [Olavius algarvensis associated proteobacterium Delta 3]|nr:hypothetical protein D3OALGA1CA_2804 [Olavius algarvensis associated proteobacterium Delta 3]CAB5163954.1 hypothetical protein D3OALGB2SA_5619 [Olavius algarvensis associated proteobacterium Delta 3]